jgi:hypothetical protein
MAFTKKILYDAKKNVLAIRLGSRFFAQSMIVIMARQSETRSAITSTLISDEQLLQSKGKSFFCDGTLRQLYQSFLVVSQDPIREMGQNLQLYGSASLCETQATRFWILSLHKV